MITHGKATTRDETDELAEHARSMKTLTTVAKIQHIASMLPFTEIGDNGMFMAQDRKMHRASDFDWIDGRYQV